MEKYASSNDFHESLTKLNTITYDNLLNEVKNFPSVSIDLVNKIEGIFEIFFTVFRNFRNKERFM